MDIEPVGDGRAVLKYLAPYVYRVAICGKRIMACDDHSVTYTYTPRKSKVTKTRNVKGEQFVGGFVQHTLAHGFQKLRHYGWMNSHSKIKVDEIRWLVWLFLGWTYWLASGHLSQEKPIPRQVRCAACDEPMRIVAVVILDCQVLWEHGVKYLDSG